MKAGKLVVFTLKSLFQADKILRVCAKEADFPKLRFGPGLYLFRNQCGRWKIRIYLWTVFLRPGQIWGTSAKPMSKTHYIQEIIGSLGDHAAWSAFTEHLQKKGWSLERLEDRRRRNQLLIGKYRKRPGSFSIAVRPSEARGRFYFFDGRHRGTIADLLGGEFSRIRCRILWSSNLLKVLESWK